MIPILYDGTTLKGFLADTLTCEVTEERNGVYELLMTYPITGNLFSEIIEDRYIKAKPNDTSENQLFRIYKVSKPLNGIITISAEHISYALSHYPVTNVSMTGVNATVAINAVLSSATSNLGSSHGFSVATSDITSTHNFAVQVASARGALGGMEGSVLDLYGGEYEFDNFVIRLHKNRGEDTGVIISYGKNLTDVKLVSSVENSYTALFPYCVKDDKLTVLSEKRISVTNSSGIKTRVLLKDFTSMFGNDEEITEVALRTKANAWLAENDINSPSINLTVSFIHLWQSPEYKDFAALEKVSLCDTVTVFYKDLGINIKAKVIKTVYDTLAERYTKIEIGTAKANFSDTLKQTTKQLESAIKAIENADVSAITQEFLQAIEDATNAITGNSGGYVVLNPAENPRELLVMNTANIDTASKVWRWNVSGLGYSSNGYSGPYKTAITMNGAIVADFITTGTLTANIIRAGVLSSVDGQSYFNLETGVIQTSRANITGGYISIGGDTYKSVIADGALTQYLGSDDDNLVGGVVPVGTGGVLYQCLYCGNNSNIGGIVLGQSDDNGTITTYLELTSSRASFAKNLYTNGNCHASGNLTVYGTAEVWKKLTVYDNSILTNGNGSNLFAAVTHYRTTAFGSNTYTASVALGCGIAEQRPSAALEIKNYGSSTIIGRLDVYESSGEAMISLRGCSRGSYSKILELGASMWFGGDIYSKGYLVSSTEEVKENITDIDSVLDLFKESTIYKYRYKDDEEEVVEEDTVDDEWHTLSENSGLIIIEEEMLNLGASADGSETTVEEAEPNNFGFVIGRETPNEVISADGKHIDVYSMAAVNWKATQELLSRIESLEAKLNGGNS